MSISALNTGLSGMRGAQRALDISANNIANASTPNYPVEQAKFSEGTAGGVVVSLSAAANGSDPDLANDIVNQIQYKASFQASAKVVQTADDLLGSLLDIGK